MAEKQLWNRLRGGILPRGHYSRIESEPAPGFPDVNYCIEGVEGNIELKDSRKPKAHLPFKIRGIRLSQELWIRDRVAESGNVWLIVRIGSEIHLLRGYYAKYLNDWTLSQIRNHSQWCLNRGRLNKENIKDLKYWLKSTQDGRLR
jgi:hypothetical protein